MLHVSTFCARSGCAHADESARQPSPCAAVWLMAVPEQARLPFNLAPLTLIVSSLCFLAFQRALSLYYSKSSSQG